MSTHQKGHSRKAKVGLEGRLEQLNFPRQWQGFRFVGLVSKTWQKKMSSRPFLEKNNAGLERRFEKLDFPWPPQGPHFLVLCPRLGRKHWPPPPLLKKTRPALRLVWRCWIFVAHGRDLTFLCCVQDLPENNCDRAHFWKKQGELWSLFGNVGFS